MNIFISYRRQDTPNVSGRIYDELARHFGADTVFKDVDDIPLGVNFETYLQDVIQESSVMLVVIGANWLDATDARGQPRLELEDDFVHIELKAALARGIPIVPLLTQEAAMPRRSELPPALAALSLHNGIRIRPDPDFHWDMSRLIRHLEPYVSTTQPTAAARPWQGPAPGPPQAQPREEEGKPQVDPAQLAALYTDARSAYYTRQWEKAAELLGQIVALDPDYDAGRAANRLEQAKRQHTLLRRYTLGQEAFETQRWSEAIEHLEAVVALEANYEDAAARVQEAKRQKQLADLYADARQLHQAKAWPAVIEVFEQIRRIEPDYADPDELLPSARDAAEAEARAKRLAALYDQGLSYIDAQEWAQAVKCFERVAKIEPDYCDTAALLERAQREAEIQERERRLAELYRRALEQMDAEEWSEAEKSLAQIAQWEPNYRETEALLARARQEARNPKPPPGPADARDAQTTAASPSAKLAGRRSARPLSRPRRTWLWVALGVVALAVIGGGVWLAASSRAAKTLRPGETVSGRVTDVHGEIWKFRGEQDAFVRLTLLCHPTESDALYMVLYDPEGKVAYVGDGCEWFIYRLEHSGTYTVAVRGSLGATGDYTLRLQ